MADNQEDTGTQAQDAEEVPVSAPGTAEDYKKKGNEAFQAQDWNEAIFFYNKAIQLDPKQASYWSNRAACWSSKGNHANALNDATRCVEADPNFVKGYSRKGKALLDLGRLDEAEAAYKEGLKKEPANTGCLLGLEEVRGKKADVPKALLPEGFWERLWNNLRQRNILGRLQMYALVFCCWMGYQAWQKDKLDSALEQRKNRTLTEEEVFIAPSSAAPWRRSFAEVDGSWVSWLEAGSTAGPAVLLLHRTSLSAEGEWSGLMARLLREGAGPAQLLAPDRPCHGFTPCRAGAGWLEELLAKRPAQGQLTIVASGRAAVRQALDLAGLRARPSRLLLVNPRLAAPSPTLQGALHDSSAVIQWLVRNKDLPSGVAAADAARWAVVTSYEEGAEEEDDKIAVPSLPEGSRVLTVYTSGHKEDKELKEELEGQGLSVETRKVGGLANLDSVITEPWASSSSTASAGRGSKDRDEV